MGRARLTTRARLHDRAVAGAGPRPRRYLRSAVSTAVLALALLPSAACEKAALAPAAPHAAAARLSLTSITFTKIPPAQANHSIASPLAGLETIVFQMNASQAAGVVVKQFGFMIAGSLQTGDVANYQLFYYPQGLANPGVLVGTNNGSTWAPPGGSPSSFIYIDLSSPLTIPKGKSFTAIFALRADVTGLGTFFFYPRVQTCLVTEAGVDKDVTWLGGDLPLQGDVYYVN